MPTIVLNIGILSTANIANKVVDAIQQSGVAVAYCVGSRSLDKAKEFAQRNKMSVAYGSYEQVIEDQKVDAVYIPIPTAHRTAWVVRAAKAGKHIL